MSWLRHGFVPLLNPLVAHSEISKFCGTHKLFIVIVEFCSGAVFLIFAFVHFVDLYCLRR